MQKHIKNTQKRFILSYFYPKTSSFLHEKRCKREVKTAFSGLFWVFLGSKVYQLRQVYQL